MKQLNQLNIEILSDAKSFRRVAPRRALDPRSDAFHQFAGDGLLRAPFLLRYGRTSHANDFSTCCQPQRLQSLGSKRRAPSDEFVSANVKSELPNSASASVDTAMIQNQFEA